MYFSPPFCSGPWCPRSAHRPDCSISCRRNFLQQPVQRGRMSTGCVDFSSLSVGQSLVSPVTTRTEHTVSSCFKTTTGIAAAWLGKHSETQRVGTAPWRARSVQGLLQAGWLWVTYSPCENKPGGTSQPQPKGSCSGEVSKDSLGVRETSWSFSSLCRWLGHWGESVCVGCICLKLLRRCLSSTAVDKQSII